MQDKVIKVKYKYVKGQDYRYKAINEKRLISFTHLLNNPCEQCGEDNPVCLEYDHKSRDKKIDSISNMIYGYQYSIEDLKKEIKKCRILCGNCHQIRSAKQLNYWHTIKK